MITNVTVKTTIRVNGRVYGSVDEMPADVRQAYERALASMGATTAEKMASGSTQTKLVSKDGGTTALTATKTTLRFNGQEYGSVDEMPATVRHLFEGVMATVDANGNGIPDVLETTAQGTSGSLLAPNNMTAASVAGGIVRPDSTRGWLVIAGVVVALWLLWSFSFGR